MGSSARGGFKMECAVCKKARRPPAADGLSNLQASGTYCLGAK
jgi:hypothetical protein